MAALTTACASTPPPVTFDLTAPNAVRAFGGGQAQVVVIQPSAVQPLSSQQIVVKDATGSISSVGGAQWADQLPDLVQARLIHTFENASRVRAVGRPGAGVAADYQLVSEIRAFQVMTPANEALVEISTKLVSDQTGRIVGGKVFSARVPVATVDAPNAARALDQALASVLIDIVRWTSANSSKPEPAA